VENIKDQLLENNKKTYWVPDFVKVCFSSFFVLISMVFCLHTIVIRMFALTLFRRNVSITGWKMLEIGLSVEADFGALHFLCG